MNPALDIYLGLGSNLQNPLGQVQNAITRLARLDECELIKTSSLYRSKPMGPQNQPDYVNAVVAMRTSLMALDLLQLLQSIETAQGRQRNGPRWGPRTLDIDILLYGNYEINTAELTVPHPGLSERDFVLYPLYEIAPDLLIPSLGSLKNLLKKQQSHVLERISSKE